MDILTDSNQNPSSTSCETVDSAEDSASGGPLPQSPRLLATQRFYEASPGLVTILTPDGRVLYINPFGIRFWNVQTEKILGRPFRELANITTRDGMDPHGWFLQLERDTDPFSYLESLCMRPDQRPTRLFWTKAVEFDGQGQVCWVVLAGHVPLVDELKEKKLSIRLATAMMRSNISGRLLMANADSHVDEFKVLLGQIAAFLSADRCFFLLAQSSGELRSLVVQSCTFRPDESKLRFSLTPDNAPRTFDALSRLEVVRFSSDDLVYDGLPDRKWFLSRSAASSVLVPVVLEDRLMACLGVDAYQAGQHWVSEDAELLRSAAEIFATTIARVRAEQALKLSEQRFRRLVERAPLGILTMGRSGYPKQFNPPMKEIATRLGISVTQPSNLLQEPRFCENGLVSDLNRCLGGEVVAPVTRSIRAADGTLLYFRTHLTALHNDQGYITGVQTIVEDITQLIRAEHAVREKERYLAALLSALKTGVMVIDPDKRTIVEVNPHACRMIGMKRADIIGKPCYHFFHPIHKDTCPIVDLKEPVDNVERLLYRSSGETVPILKSISRIPKSGKDYLLECFTDIRELSRLLKEQQMDIGTAKNILKVINGRFHRHSPLGEARSLFASVLYLPCKAEGGDHFFLRTLPGDGDCLKGRTVVSLKDQSGHQVGCLLRSIITDLIHQSILTSGLTNGLTSGLTGGIGNGWDDFLRESLTRLNYQLVDGGLLEADKFCAATVLDIDHENLRMRYLICGQPRFMVIRDNCFQEVPPPGKRDGTNLPLGILPHQVSQSGEMTLRRGDRIILFTDGLTDATVADLSGSANTGSLTCPELIKLAQGEASDALQQPLEELMQLILRGVARACGRILDPAAGTNDSPDDITLMGLEIESTEGEYRDVWHPRNAADMHDKMESFLMARIPEWEQNGFGDPGRLRLAFEEAMINAWRHGNRQQVGKSVVVSHRWGNDFHLSIEDCGNGFDFTNLSDPSAPFNRLRSHGRGIFLMKQAATEVEYNTSGNRVCMAFAKNPHHPVMSQGTEPTPSFSSVAEPC